MARNLTRNIPDVNLFGYDIPKWAVIVIVVVLLYVLYNMFFGAGAETTTVITTTTEQEGGQYRYPWYYYGNPWYTRWFPWGSYIKRPWGGQRCSPYFGTPVYV